MFTDSGPRSLTVKAFTDSTEGSQQYFYTQGYVPNAYDNSFVFKMGDQELIVVYKKYSSEDEVFLERLRLRDNTLSEPVFSAGLTDTPNQDNYGPYKNLKKLREKEKMDLDDGYSVDYDREGNILFSRTFKAAETEKPKTVEVAKIPTTLDVKGVFDKLFSQELISNPYSAPSREDDSWRNRNFSEVSGIRFTPLSESSLRIVQQMHRDIGKK